MSRLPAEEGECVLFTGYRNPKGYGQKWDGTKVKLAHRLAMERHLGRELLSTECVCHRCDTPACINISHLFIGTPADNTRDMLAKGRVWRGRTKLTAEQVRAIRGETPRYGYLAELASRHGVSKTTIVDVRNRKHYAHLA